MSLDISKPTDQELVSKWPYWVRESREEINSLEIGIVDLVFTNLVVLAGSTTLTIGTELSISDFEYIVIDGVGAAPINQIRGGAEGLVKTFIFKGNNVSFVDGPKSDGRLYLNQLPVFSTFNAQQDDVITLVNIGGDGAGDYGYWKELSRQLSVK